MNIRDYYLRYVRGPQPPIQPDKPWPKPTRPAESPDYYRGMAAAKRIQRDIEHEERFSVSTQLLSLARWTATALSVVGTAFVSLGDARGLWFWLPANALWIVLQWRRRDWAQVVLFGIYEVFTVVGLLAWR